MSFSEPEDERAAFLHDGEVKSGPKSTWKRHAHKIIMICNILLFLVSISLFSTWYYETYMRKNSALRRISTYSPILDQYDLQFQTKKINGTLYPPKVDPPLARQRPSPELDAIWEEWEITRVLPVSSAQIRAMGKDPSTVTKLEDEVWGLGDDAYATILDVFHQVHCLNSLRKLVYPDYYTGGHSTNAADPQAMFEIHMNHCVDLLLQAIQCSGNLNLITLHWVEYEPYPFPDMSLNRKCINFDALTQWRLDNTIDMDKYVEKVTKPEDVKQLPQSDGYFKYIRPDFRNPNHINGANPDVDFNL